MARSKNTNDDGDDPLVQSHEDDADLELESDGPMHRRVLVKRHLKKRIDSYLRERLGGISRNQIKKLIDMGMVKINDVPVKASTTVKRGDEVDVVLPPKPPGAFEAEDIPLDIVYEDQYFIVLNKQAGLIVHPARSHLSGTMINGLAYHFQQQGLKQAQRKLRRGEIDGKVKGLSDVGADECRPGIVHRLDKNTTGCIVVAKHDEAHWQIAVQFEQRRVLKSYLAVVHGNFDRPGGVIDQPLAQHPTIREAHAVRHDSKGKHSVTIYRVREQYQGYALVELELKTGRTHQIRVHMSYIGHPLVGDIIYGGETVGPPELDCPPTAAGARTHLNFARNKEEGQEEERLAAERTDVLMSTPALHAALLEIEHPIKKERMRFTAPTHGPLGNLIKELRKIPKDGPVAKDGFYVDLKKALEEC